MPKTINENLKLRKYLLGEITGETEREKIELKLITDEKYFQELLIEEEELVQNYVDGELTSGEQVDFEKNFLISEERQKSVMFARLLRKYIDGQNESKKPVKQHKNEKEKNFWSFFSPIFRSPLPIAAAGLVIISLSLLLVWIFYLRPSNAEQALASLNSSYKLGRPLESRITDFTYAPFQIVRGEDETKIGITERNRAERILLDEAIERPTAENLHSLGRLYLAKKEFDEAVRQLEKAQQLAPQNAEILSDLGTAYLEKSKILSEGKDGKSLELAAKALENFQKAIEISPRLFEARFNKAGCLQILHLPKQAEKAWRDYLEIDSDSQWAEEARRNLQLLESSARQSKTAGEILQDFLAAHQNREDERAYQIISRNREMITGKLISQQLAFLFIEAKSSGNEAKSADFLDALAYAGKLEEKNSGDSFVSGMAQYYALLSPSQIIILKQAQNLVKTGYRLCLDGKYKEALKEFEFAQNLFFKAADVLEATLTDYWIGYCLFRVNQIEASAKILDGLVKSCKKNNYKWLLSLSFTWLANIEGTANNYSKEIKFNEQALELSKEVFDLYNMQKVLSQLSDNYRQTSRYQEALKFAQESLQIGVLPEASPRQKYRDYDTIANMFYGMKFYETSLAYQREALILSLEKLDEKTFTHAAYVNLGLINGMLGKYREAFDFFENGYKTALNFENEAAKNKALAYTRLQIAHVNRQAKNYPEAIDNYNQAIEFFESGNYQVNRYDAHKGRLLCYFAVKDDFAFQQELSILLKIFEDYRTTILEEQSRNSFFDNEQGVYDLAVDYEYGKGNYETAFNYSEESRSRSLFDLLQTGAGVSDNRLDIKFSPVTSKPLNLSEIRSQMPEKVQIVEYTVLEDKVLIWLITREDVEVFASKVSEEKLREKVFLYHQFVSKKIEPDPNAEKSLAVELYQILIEPFKKKLHADKEICLILDKFLFYLPFSSLISPETGEYFITEKNFFFAPSANIFLVCSKKSNELRLLSNETFLGIGNPAFSQNHFPDLPKLASAEKEAEEISRNYKTNTCLIGKHAAKEQIMRNLPKANVVHFAGHYIADEFSPLLSGLVLAENAKTLSKQDSILANHEIIGAKLSNTRLIVLSACRTGTEKYYNGEGMIGVSRTFLATGTPLVVASQWAVDSDSTAELMIKFHHYRKTEQLSTVKALRRAQMEMAEGGNERFRHPFYWAPFITLGGYSEF
ncbi:MAG: CHAT domain-containing protein [Pyrinomonadaceae bacterium]